MSRFMVVASVALLAVAGCSGDDSGGGAAPVDPVSSAASSIVPADATTTAVPATTAAPTTTATPTTTTPPTTTTTLVMPEVSILLTSLPGPTQLPPGWTSEGGLGSSSLEPASGPGLGLCSGPNADQRALDAAVVAMISSPTFILDDGNTGRITLYGFESAEAASRLMDATRQQVNCPGLPPFQLPEEVYDGFDDNGSIRVMWDLTDVHTLGGSPVPEGQADAAFTVLTRSIATTRYAGTDFGGESSSAQIWEQHGPIVVLAATSGFCCSYGFSNNEGITDAPASMPTLIAGMDVIRPIILENLRARGLIPA